MTDVTNFGSGPLGGGPLPFPPPMAPRPRRRLRTALIAAVLIGIPAITLLVLHVTSAIASTGAAGGCGGG